MDLSPDGRTVAIVLGDPEAAGLELVTLDVETGAASTRSIDLMANGPPTWLGPDQLALEVIRADQHSGIATVETATGAVTVTDAQGFALSATRDGSRIAVADAISGLVSIMDRKDWLAGVPSDASGITPPTDTSIQGIAINADGTRLALACSTNTGTSWSVVILGQAGSTWEKATSISIPDDAAVSIDWLAVIGRPKLNPARRSAVQGKAPSEQRRAKRVHGSKRERTMRCVSEKRRRQRRHGPSSGART